MIKKILTFNDNNNILDKGETKSSPKNKNLIEFLIKIFRMKLEFEKKKK